MSSAIQSMGSARQSMSSAIQSMGSARQSMSSVTQKLSSATQESSFVSYIMGSIVHFSVPLLGGTLVWLSLAVVPLVSSNRQ